jgi:fructose-bisphosphate aldolase, class I
MAAHKASFPPHMKNFRLNRLFNPLSGRCIDVAVDHGFFNELNFLSGIEDLAKAVDVLVEANPDAIQLTIGQAELLQRIPGKAKPALVLRTDVANVYGKELPRALFSRMIERAVEQAIRLDAVCVVVNLFRIPGQPEVTDQCIQNILRLKPECDRFNFPLMIEPLVFRPNTEAGGYMVDGDIRKILPLVRQAVELGADVIKADPTDKSQEYHRVIQAARVPVLVRGGGKADDLEVLERTEQVIAQGAAGIVYGRNIIQHANPAGMTKALLAIVHHGAKAEEAAAFL